MTDQPTDDFTVHLTLPSTKRSVRPARSVAASIGVDVGMDLDELDDLRVAVQEAMALVIDHTDDRIAMSVRPDGDALEVTVSCDSPDPLPGASHLARQLLDVLVAEHRVDSADGRQSIWLRSHPAGDDTHG